MVVRAMFLECSDEFWSSVGELLVRDHAWEVAYWTASRERIAATRRFAPNAVVQDRLEAIRGVPAPKLRALASPVDEALLRDLAVVESTTLAMMARMDPGWSFPHEERKRLYHKHLSYWQAVLAELRPDVVVFPTCPHVGYDYVIYALCARLGIRRALFERTSFAGRVFLEESFEAGPAEALADYASRLEQDPPPEVELRPELEQAIERVSEGRYESAVPFSLTGGAAAFRRRGRRPLELLRAALPHRWPGAARGIGRFLLDPPPPNYLVQRGKPLEHSMSGLRIRVHRQLEGRARIERLRRAYTRLAREPDWGRPYVFVALSYQPERTTSPLAGPFVRLGLMVSLLSRELPEGWLLYVKEHASIFSPSKRGYLARRPSDYEDMAALPNVRLVPASQTPFRLIDHSRAVATTTGTVGWEAILRGKPALLFGYPWYRGCEGSFRVTNAAECREVLERIRAGYEVDRRRVRLFVHALDRASLSGYVSARLASISGVDEQQNVKNLSAALATHAARRPSPSSGLSGILPSPSPGEAR